MGVEGLYKFINKHCSEIYRNVSIFDIKDKSCIIDGMQHIYTQLIYMRSKNKEIISSVGTNISHIHGLINSLTYYLKNGIIPIFIFDGKSPDIKKKKIEERKLILRQNLKKLRELETMKNDIKDNITNLQLNNDTLSDVPDDYESMIVGTPPEFFNLNEEMQKMQNVQEEYRKIYKKSIVLKDYFVADWIQILEFLGLPVLKAKGEADPLCSYVLKNNNHVYGIISDDSDMLVFGAPRLMRKSINQQFTIIELNELISSINKLLLNDENYSLNNIDNKKFEKNNLIDFSLLLGTDYAIFKLQTDFTDTYELLKYYMLNGIEKLIHSEDIENFYQIKKYYENLDFDESYNFILEKPTWKKPQLLELKKRLLDLNVEEEYIDRNYELFDIYYNKYLRKISSLNSDDFDFRNKKNILTGGKIFDSNHVPKYFYKKPPFYPTNRYNSNYNPAENCNYLNQSITRSNPIPISTSNSIPANNLYRRKVNNLIKIIPNLNNEVNNEEESSSDKSNSSNDSYKSEQNYKLKSQVTSGSASDYDMYNL